MRAKTIAKGLLSAAVLTLLTLTATSPAQAAFIFINSRAGLTDTVDWGQLGAPFTNVPNPTTAVSTHGVTVTVSKTQAGQFQRRDEGNGWDGIFAVGDHLLWTQDFNSSPNVLSIGTGFQAGGAQVQADFFGAYTARVTAFDAAGNVLASFTANGNNTGAEDNSAPFLGILSTGGPIAKIGFDITSAAGDTADFAINQFSFSPAAAAAVPEPASLTLLGLGALGLVGYRFRRRKQAT